MTIHNNYLLPLRRESLFSNSMVFVVLATLLLFSQSSWANSLARIITTTGQAEIRASASAPWIKARPLTELEAGSQIRTGSDGKVALLLADESMIQLGKNSSFTVKSVGKKADWLNKASTTAAAQEQGSNYKINKGVMWLLNKHKKTNILIDTPSVTAAIRGTEIRIEVDEDDTARVGVLEGEVLAFNDFGEVSLFAGEEAVTQPGQAPTKQILLNPYDAVQWTIYIPRILDSTAFRLAEFPFAGSIRNNTELMRGVRLRDQGNDEEANAIFNQADSEVYGLALQAWLHMDKNELAEAETVLAQIAEDNDFVRATRIQLAIEQEQWAVAQSMLSEVSAISESSWFTNQLAWVSLLNGNADKAAQILSAQPEDAKTPVSYELSALASLVLNDKQQAISDALQATEMAPGHANSWIVRSMIEQSDFDLAASENSIRKALALDPENSQANLRLARLRFANGDAKSAQQATRKVLQLDDESAQAHSLMGFILLARKETALARAHFEKAIEINTDLADPQLGLSLVAIRDGNEEEALEAISSAVLLEPRRSLYRSYWAKMLHQFGRYHRALDVLDIAKNLDEQDPTPFLYRAMILRDLNRPAEAVRELNKAIALNDNKAVYRSRYLLDKDLAVKNVDLSLAYTELGLDDWAEHKAVTSIKSDYANASAHIFYAGSLTEKTERSWARNSENLLGRLLMPANSNSFSSFNDYTTFFEQPSLDGEVIVEVGTQDHAKGEIYASGAQPDKDIAYLLYAGHEEKNGWNDLNGEDLDNFASWLKWDINDRDSLMLVASYSNSLITGRNRTQYNVGDTSFARHKDNVDSESYRFEVGFHRKVDQKNDLLLHLQHLGLDVSSETSWCILGNCVTNYADMIYYAQMDQPFTQLQGQWIHNAGDHQLIGGVAYYHGDDDASDLLSVYTQAGLLGSFPAGAYGADRNALTFFGQDIWQINEKLSLESGIFIDEMTLSDSLGNNAQWTHRSINPRLGIGWSVTPQTSLQLAAYRYVLPFYSDRLDPSNIAGFAIYRNAAPGTQTSEYDLGITHEWENTFLSAELFAYKQVYRSLQNNLMNTSTAKSRGVELGLNHLFENGLGLSADYQYLDIKDPVNYAYLDAFRQLVPVNQVNEHKLVTGLNWVHPSGHSLGGKLTYRDIDYRDNALPHESLWIADLEYEYTFPDKSMSIKLEGKNLFNERFNWLTSQYDFEGRAPEQEIIMTFSVSY